MRGVRARHCARHRSIGREKTGKTLTIKRRVWDLALFTIESQDKKEKTPENDRFMPSLLVLSLHNNAFQFSEHVSMFQTSSSAIMNICKDLQKWSVYITTHIQ